MNNQQKETLEIRMLLSEFLGGEVTAKRLFIGYSFFFEENMFGLYKNNVFYLKAEDDFAVYLMTKGAVSWNISGENKNLQVSHFYRLPLEILENKIIYKKIVLFAVNRIKKKKLQIELDKKTRIKELLNLSIKYERKLAKIGVYSVKQFRTIGAIRCFIKLKQAGINVHIGFFWAIFAALKNKKVGLLTLTEKQQALEKLNQALFNTGFRRFHKIE